MMLFLATCILQTGCEKDAEVQPKNYPFVIVDKVDCKTNQYVTFHAKISYDENLDIIDHGFIIKDMASNLSYKLEINKSLGLLEKDQSEFSYTLYSGLVYGMEFSVRAYTKTINNVVYSNEVIFISTLHIQ